MAIAPTGNIYKALEFDGESSRSYGVYITGQAVYNAPERDVEMISILGRNGSYSLDNGRFQNIEVTYPAGIFADNETDFRNAISDFRNFLCSKRGYVRLTDEYNPTEYRMAIYKSGLEVEPTLLKAGEFEITFECMPQRWLTSGESSISVTDGDTITNPTRFDARPLLEVEGYGDIGIGSQTITVNNDPIGNTFLGAGTFAPTTMIFDPSVLENGDSIYLSNESVPHVYILMTPENSNYTITDATIVSSSNANAHFIPRYTAIGFYVQGGMNFSYGTSKTITSSVSAHVEGTVHGEYYPFGLVTFTYTITYNGVGTITITINFSAVPSTLTVSPTANSTQIWGNSTKVVAASPLYIDLDIGEAYGEVSGEMTSLNNTVNLPATLPVLSSGANIIAYDNTITSLSITPRWWKV